MHIKVKQDGGLAFYDSGTCWQINPDGSTHEVLRTEEEMIQQCYDGLINHVKRNEFDRNLKNLILGYLNWDQKDCTNIRIEVNGINGRHCEMNTTVTDVEWDELKSKFLNNEINK